MSPLLPLANAALPFVLTPGASFSLTLSNTSLGRRASWLRISVGTSAGIFTLAIAFGATGIGTAVRTHPYLRALLGLVGALVLVALGVILIARSRRSGLAQRRRPGGLTRWAYASVVTGPKALGLYALVVPTLSSTRLNGFGLFIAFAGIHAMMHCLWLLLVYEGAIRFPGLANSTTARRAISVIAGALMIILGLATATAAASQL